jgi:hypothetical protein
MLGLELSERTISRWMKRAPRDPEAARRWLVFLRNHREAIAAMDFFTVPTITFGFLYLLLRDRPRSSVHPARERHQSSDEYVDRPAVAGGVSIRAGSQVSDLRPRCEIRVGGPGRHSISEDDSCADLLRKSLAEWRGGALGRKLPTRPTGSHHCAAAADLCTAGAGRVALPLRLHNLGAREEIGAVSEQSITQQETRPVRWQKRVVGPPSS